MDEKLQPEFGRKANLCDNPANSPSSISFLARGSLTRQYYPVNRLHPQGRSVNRILRQRNDHNVPPLVNLSESEVNDLPIFRHDNTESFSSSLIPLAFGNQDTVVQKSSLHSFIQRT
jgi:hypothetical protein